MYKPPENANRVRAMTMRFENRDISTESDAKPKIPRCRHSSETLNRQLSDPTRRNIKRTPAFRLDKTTSAFQRHHYGSVKYKFDRFDTSRLKKPNCDNIENLTDDDDDDQDKKTKDLTSLVTKMLYSEPIPKSQRKFQVKEDLKVAVDKTKTLELSDSLNTEVEASKSDVTTGTDTIKNALKRPLPSGPAPKKPPRTFQHSPQKQSQLLQIEDDFAQKLNEVLKTDHRSKNKQVTPNNSKKDPKYMLEKLENALRNNKIKFQRQKNFDYSSDDEVLKKSSKSTSASPLLKRLNETNNRTNAQKFNFGCLNTMCTEPNYEKVAESKSSFFVNKIEHIYAEPFQFEDVVRRNGGENRSESRDTIDGKQQRNSLYYMSSPVLGLQDQENGNKVESPIEQEQVGAAGKSETSSFTSDTDSNASTPTDVPNGTANAAFVVRDLIKSFEDKRDDGERGRVSLRRRAKSADRNASNRYGVVCDANRRRPPTVQRQESKFEVYVKTVRAFSVKRMGGKQLFHCCLLVGLDGNKPYIKSKFPPNIEVPPHIETLCFPDSEDHRINYSAKEQCYSLVVTDASGARVYGYCRRVLPEGSCACLPLAYCVLTKHRAPRFYGRVLRELEQHHGLPDRRRDELLGEFYRLEFPRPGHSVRVDLGKVVRSDVKYYHTKGDDDRLSIGDAENNNETAVRKSADDLKSFCVLPRPCPHGIVNLAGGGCIEDAGENNDCPICSEVTHQTLVLTLNQDMRSEETDLNKLCETLDVGLLQKVFENLLLERKVIFISCHLSKLSSCIEAIQSVLYPFSWPHAFIPVLPKTRWEIVEAPAPLICGVLSVSVVNEYKIENAIVVDLDSKEVLIEVEDDEKILPACAVKSWKKGLDAANSIVTSDNEHNILLSDAFIRVFIQTCGHYREFIKGNEFDKEEFKQFPKSKGTRRFLQWFTQTSMFDLFIDAVLSNPDSFYIFDNRIKIYSSQDATLILEKMKYWKRL